MEITRRTLLQAGALLAAAAPSARPAPSDRIAVGVIGTGARGQELMDALQQHPQAEIVGLIDAYKGRLDRALSRVKGGAGRAKIYPTHRELLAEKSIDAVVVAIPDHLHTAVVVDALRAGKDVYCEKPLTYTPAEGLEIIAAAAAGRRIVQVGSQGVSSDLERKAKEMIRAGKLGRITMIHAAINRNTASGAWIYPIPPDASPETVNWAMFQGSASPRPFSLERFFRWRCYQEYSGGIATDLFYHVAAPLNICWGEAQFPYKVMSGGEIAIFKTQPDGRPDREVPDTFHLIAEYAKGHSLVLTSSMANDQHIPGLIRGHEGTIVMVEHGQFERNTPYITVKPQVIRPWGKDGALPTAVTPEYQKKFGLDPIQIAVDQGDMDELHKQNFLDCMRSREKPHLDVETGARAQAVITLAVLSYRQGQILYWDEKNWKPVTRPPAGA